MPATKENAALQVAYADSFRLEQQIAESMDMDNSCGNQNLFGNEDFTRLDASMSLVECFSDVHLLARASLSRPLTVVLQSSSQKRF